MDIATIASITASCVTFVGAYVICYQLKELNDRLEKIHAKVINLEFKSSIPDGPIPITNGGSGVSRIPLGMQMISGYPPIVTCPRPDDIALSNAGQMTYTKQEPIDLVQPVAEKNTGIPARNTISIPAVAEKKKRKRRSPAQIAADLEILKRNTTPTTFKKIVKKEPKQTV